jgi:hypothetical protein
MNRNYSRVAALAFFLYVSIAPIASAAAPRGRDRDWIDASEPRMVRVVKKIKNFFRGFTSLDEQMPPIPKP